MHPELETAIKSIESKVNAGDPVAAAVATVAQVLSDALSSLADPVPAPAPEE